MTETAYAAVLTEVRKFETREVPIPDIGPDEGLLRMEAAGLCGTDYEQFDGHFIGTTHGTLPITPGHEIFGWIDRVGAKAAARWGVTSRHVTVARGQLTSGRAVSGGAALT